MDAKQCVGIGLEWDYNKRALDCSMDEHIETALQEFEHALPKQFYHAPSKMVRPDYGATMQYVEDDASRKLKPEEIKQTQKVVGKFLFLARAADNTMLHALNEIACNVPAGTEKTLEAAMYLLNYIACNPKPRIQYQASDMTLQIDSDAAFHVCPQAQSRAGGYLYLGSRDNNLFNAPILVTSKVIKHVMGSAAEAEVAAIHLNATEAMPIRQCLRDMGHYQPATRIRTDDAAAKGFINGAIKEERSKTFDRRYWWLKDRESQLQFHVIWEPGIYNLADYPTKHHASSHHKLVRPICPCIRGKSLKCLHECENILQTTEPIKKAMPTIRKYRCLLAAAAAQDLQGCAENALRTNNNSCAHR